MGQLDTGVDVVVCPCCGSRVAMASLEGREDYPAQSETSEEGGAGQHHGPRAFMVHSKKRSGKRRLDPRTDPEATLEDFVWRMNRMGFPAAQRADFPIWTISDIRWTAVEIEKFYASLKHHGWESKADPLERVLQSRWAVIKLAHAMSHKTNNLEARSILAHYR